MSKKNAASSSKSPVSSKKKANAPTLSDAEQMLLDLAINLDSDSLESLEYDPEAIAEHVWETGKDALFDEFGDSEEVDTDALAQAIRRAGEAGEIEDWPTR